MNLAIVFFLLINIIIVVYVNLFKYITQDSHDALSVSIMSAISNKMGCQTFAVEFSLARFHCKSETILLLGTLKIKTWNTPLHFRWTLQLGFPVMKQNLSSLFYTILCKYITRDVIMKKWCTLIWRPFQNKQ